MQLVMHDVHYLTFAFSQFANKPTPTVYLEQSPTCINCFHPNTWKFLLHNIPGKDLLPVAVYGEVMNITETGFVVMVRFTIWNITTAPSDSATVYVVGSNSTTTASIWKCAYCIHCTVVYVTVCDTHLWDNVWLCCQSHHTGPSNECYFVVIAATLVHPAAPQVW